RDRPGLGLALAGAIEFLRQAGLVRVSAAEVLRAWRARSREVRPFDWLDTELIDAALERLERSEAAPLAVAPAAERPVRPAVASPRRQRLISALAETIAAELPAISACGLNAAAARVLVLSRLVAQNPEWDGDPLAAQAIDGILATATWLA